jgi:DNA replication protein DnaC
MSEVRHGLRSIGDIAMSQQRFCEVCGKAFKNANLPMMPKAVVADCECLKAVAKADEDAKAAEENIRYARIPRRLADLEFDTYPDPGSEEVKLVRNYLSMPRPGLLLLVGSVGRGKSGLACAALRAMARKRSVRYFYAFDLLTDRVSRDTMEVMREALSPDAIVIDEIGLQLKTAAANEFMERLLIGRHDDYKSTILISNLAMNDFKPLIGARAWDRATNAGTLVVFSGETFRGAQ